MLNSMRGKVTRIISTSLVGSNISNVGIVSNVLLKQSPMISSLKSSRYASSASKTSKGKVVLLYRLVLMHVSSMNR
jgi:hypothetical protein